MALYIPEEMFQEAREEAPRQDRSLSWIIWTAWRIARGEMSP